MYSFIPLNTSLKCFCVFVGTLFLNAPKPMIMNIFVLFKLASSNLNLELYKVNKVLGYGDLIRIQAQNNPDLKDLTEEEKQQQLLQQEYEWKHGPQNKQESEETDIHEMMYE